MKLGTIALLAGAAKGTVDGLEMSRKQQQEDADRAFQQTQRDRTLQQQADEDALKQKLQSANAPVAVMEGAGGQVLDPSADNRDAGLPGTTMMPVAFRVGATGYDTRSEADAAAAQQNTPEARQQRSIAALEGSGQWRDAATMRATGTQQQANDLALDQAKRADAHDKVFRDVVGQLAQGGWPAIPKIYQSYNDGNTATVQEDGKGGATITQLGPDGKTIGTRTFANPMEFVTSMLPKIDPKLWVTVESQRQAAAQKQANTDRSYGLEERKLGATTARTAEMALTRQAAAEQKAAEARTAAAGKLRTEFNGLPEVKNYTQALPSYKGIEDAVSRNTPMSDINLVYGIAKLYDPNSVVREGEYNTVASAPNIPERVKGWVQYVAGGGKLTPEVKGQILKEAQSRIKTYEDQYLNQATRYKDLATRTGADPTLVFPTNFKSAIAPAAPKAGDIVTGNGGQKFRFKGGNPNDKSQYEVVQ